MFELVKTLLLPVAEHVSVTQSTIVVFITIALWMMLWKISYKGISLWISAIMFSGILLWHLGYHINPEVADFLKDFWLILFVYGIGIQVWPYFFSSFKKQGLRFNILAIAIVLLWGSLALGIYYFSGIGIDNIVGMMSGAVTNTPWLWAAQSVLHDIALVRHTTFSDPANAYALSYPFGVLGVIIVMILGKWIMRINTTKEQEKFLIQSELTNPSPVKIACRVINQAIIGKTIKQVLDIVHNKQVHLTRIKRSGSQEVQVAHHDMVIQEKDVIMIVWNKEDIPYVVNLLGRESSDHIIESNETTHTENYVITNREVAFHTIAQLKIYELYNVKISRIIRWEVEFVADPTTILMLWDRLIVVGHGKDLDIFETYIGNKEKKLNEPELLTICLWIVLGILVGSIPFTIWWLSYPLKLGMAAGPLIVALLISRYSVHLKISPYMHKSALLMMKDIGIALFFAVVGLKAGATFYSTFVQYNGLVWIGYGLLITLIPLLVMMLVWYYGMKINFLQLVGLMAATYTDPAALAFSTKYFESDIPNQSYATVYPLVTIMRIILAQLLILLVL